MIFELEGEVYKKVRTKKGNTMYSVLVGRPDGQKDSVNIISDDDSRNVGNISQFRVNGFVSFCNEV